eukprot:5024703-Prymnesium_polylepis.1
MARLSTQVTLYAQLQYVSTENKKQLATALRGVELLQVRVRPTPKLHPSRTLIREPERWPNPHPHRRRAAAGTGTLIGARAPTRSTNFFPAPAPARQPQPSPQPN